MMHARRRNVGPEDYLNDVVEEEGVTDDGEKKHSPPREQIQFVSLTMTVIT